jgi:hypothetical protein
MLDDINAKGLFYIRTPKLLMKLALNYTEVINGELNLGPINLMMAFRLIVRDVLYTAFLF